MTLSASKQWEGGGFFQNIEQGIFQAQLTSGFEIRERAIGWVFCPG
jgi:hypothetical protein